MWGSFDLVHIKCVEQLNNSVGARQLCKNFFTCKQKMNVCHMCAQKIKFTSQTPNTEWVSERMKHMTRQNGKRINATMCTHRQISRKLYPFRCLCWLLTVVSFSAILIHTRIAIEFVTPKHEMFEHEVFSLFVCWPKWPFSQSFAFFSFGFAVENCLFVFLPEFINFNEPKIEFKCAIEWVFNAFNFLFVSWVVSYNLMMNGIDIRNEYHTKSNKLCHAYTIWTKCTECSFDQLLLITANGMSK